MKKQTAVEFAVEKLEKFIPSGNQIAIFSILQQAKEMEKQQIIDAWMDGMEGILHKIAAEQYYNETFKKEQND